MPCGGKAHSDAEEAAAGDDEAAAAAKLIFSFKATQENRSDASSAIRAAAAKGTSPTRHMFSMVWAAVTAMRRTW